MREIWPEGTGFSSEEAYPNPTYSLGIKNEQLKSAIQIAFQTQEVKDLLSLYKDKMNTLRIVERNTYEQNHGSTTMYYYDNQKKGVYNVNKLGLDNIENNYNSYYLILRIYIYTNDFDDPTFSNDDKVAAMAITLGHELFIHYFSEAVNFWKQGDYKSALEIAQKDRGPNGGDYDHSNYIKNNKSEKSVNLMKSYLNSLSKLINIKSYNKALKEHNKTYEHLK